MKRNASSFVFLFLLGSLMPLYAGKIEAQSSFGWHAVLTQEGRNDAIVRTAFQYPTGSYVGQCKVWVSNVIRSASNGQCTLPLNDPYCMWRWNSRDGNYSNVSAVCSDRFDSNAVFLPGQIIQAQVPYSKWPYVSPHTMIVVFATREWMYVIESNFGLYNENKVGSRFLTRTEFMKRMYHYTLYQVR
jgi:hypothetical protein